MGRPLKIAIQVEKYRVDGVHSPMKLYMYTAVFRKLTFHCGDSLMCSTSFLTMSSTDRGSLVPNACNAENFFSLLINDGEACYVF